MLTSADKGGGGIWKPPNLADVICEQPLILNCGGSGYFINMLSYKLQNREDNQDDDDLPSSSREQWQPSPRTPLWQWQRDPAYRTSVSTTLSATVSSIGHINLPKPSISKAKITRPKQWIGPSAKHFNKEGLNCTYGMCKFLLKCTYRTYQFWLKCTYCMHTSYLSPAPSAVLVSKNVN